MTITAGTVEQALIAAGVPVGKITHLLDRLYRPCRAGWLVGDFARYFERTLTELDLRPSDDERFDCDKTSLVFQALAAIAHARTPDGKGGALPMGRITLRPGVQTGDVAQHTAIWTYTSDKAICFIEPQPPVHLLDYTPYQLGTTESCIP